MIIPNSIINQFEDEIDKLNYGKVSLNLIKRGSSVYFKIKKSFTIKVDENQCVNYNQNKNNQKIKENKNENK